VLQEFIAAAITGDNKGLVSAKGVDKQALLQAFGHAIEAELERAKERARDAAEGATHVENRAEGDKDMRATEASYVARGHSERVFQLEQELLRLNALEPRAFAPDEPIAPGALVCLEHDAKQAWYLLLPVAGGMRVSLGGQQFQALTSQSPLGSALLGLASEDEVEVQTPQGVRTSLIVAVR
jgi:transcription elongation GreA/GreB family factor